MSATEGLKIGKAVFYILSNDATLLNITGMSANKIQPAPLKEQSGSNVAVVYEFDAVNAFKVIKPREGAQSIII